MKKNRFHFKNLSLIAAILSFTFIFSACSKNDDAVDTEVAGLMAINLVPDKDAINLDISGSTLTQVPMDYTAYTGGYISIYPGNRRISSYSVPQMELLDTASFLFTPQKFYTVFVTGFDDDYKNIIVQDNYEALSPQAGKAFVRYINTVPGAGEFTIGGETHNAGFQQVSEFQAIDAGTVNVGFSILEADPVNRDIEFKENMAYTILISGIPGDIDIDKGVQIRYIENGRISE